MEQCLATMREPRRRRGDKWPKERDEELTRLYALLKSGEITMSDICRILSANKNEVVGRASVLGINTKRRVGLGHFTQRHPRTLQKPLSEKRPLAMVTGANQTPETTPVVPFSGTPTDLVAHSEPVTILELRENMCRWPLGEPTRDDFRFCGAKRPKDSNLPYCAYHAGIAYVPTNREQRETTQRPKCA